MCIFCKIVSGEIPSKKAYEDEDVIAIYDINPQTPVHLIFMPKKHAMTCADDITSENSYLIAKIFEAIPKAAKSLGLKDGYRIINNCGVSAGQTIMHIHFHLLSGENMSEKLL